MYKAILVLTAFIFCTINCFVPVEAEPHQATNNLSVMYRTPSKEQMRKQFEQRMQLTDEQKQQAKIIHEQGKKEIQPVMMQIYAKRQELEMIKLSKLSDKEQKERIDALTNEINSLEKQAKEIRRKNTSEFEKILNKEQKVVLQDIKAEGRARFEKSHTSRPPFQGLGVPNTLFKPLFK